MPVETSARPIFGVVTETVDVEVSPPPVFETVTVVVEVVTVVVAVDEVVTLTEVVGVEVDKVGLPVPEGPEVLTETVDVDELVESLLFTVTVTVGLPVGVDEELVLGVVDPVESTVVVIVGDADDVDVD